MKLIDYLETTATSNIVDNFVDIKFPNDFKFDVEVTAKYAAEGRNINNVTSTMLTNYQNNYVPGTRGRRRFLSSSFLNLSFPDINQYY